MYDHDWMIILALSQKSDRQIIGIWHLVLATECDYVIFPDYTVYAIIKNLHLYLKIPKNTKGCKKKKKD